MSITAKHLVQFNAPHYTYPTSISRGYWARYPIETGLSVYERERRKQWLAALIDWSRSDFHKMISETFADPSDGELLHSLLAEHGLFAERFFHLGIHERVTRQFAEADVDLQEFGKLLAVAWGRRPEDAHTPYNRGVAIYRIMDHIYEQVLVRAISDSQIYHQLENWFEEFKKPQTCALCGKWFRTIDLPDWIYFGSNGCKICCFQCPIVATPKKSELTELIRAFVESCGFVPTSMPSRLPINYAFTSRLSTDKWANVFLAYVRMGGIDHVKEQFGSWFGALAESGVLPKDILIVTPRGIRCLAQDGHFCHSFAERRIDDWLSAHGVSHEREPRYPAHPSLNPTGRRRADWRVQDTFIEYFGLIGDPGYEKKMEEKILLAQYSEIDLITLYPSDLGRLDQRFGHLLEA